MTTIRDNTGFTLIEVMVALTTMAIAFLAVCALHLTSFKTDIRNRDESRALYLANQKMEEFRSSDFSDIAVGNLEDNSNYPFILTWSVTAPQAWRRDIIVAVCWPEKIMLVGGHQSAAEGTWQCTQDGCSGAGCRDVRIATIIADLN